MNPQFIPVSEETQIADFADLLVYPVIIKPVSLTGSMLVTLCQSASDLFSAWSRIESYFVERGERPKAIIESFVGGTEYSVELMHGRALGITTKHLADGGGFVEVGFEFPAPLPTSSSTLLTESAERALERIGLTWGPAHVEIKIDGGRATIIEINARMGGLRTAELIGLSGGVNFAGAYVDALTGLEPELFRKPTRAAAVHYRRAPAGRAQMMSLDTSAALNGEGVEEVFAFDKVGKVYQTTGSNWDIAYGAIAVGKTAQDAGRVALLALDRVVVAWDGETNA
ncbi:ATP-grasp domain-containing protein [Agrobacterium radiobacter]|uniref:ATP-grasp domain-containing protein n=1 Tax=Agrobacterium radiobacter TaxID=362 RepID=UPI003F85E55C